MDDVTALRDGLLREVSRHDRHIIASMLDALIATVEAKRSAEVAALAEALEEIAERGPGTWFGQRARAALAQTPPTDAGERCAATTTHWSLAGSCASSAAPTQSQSAPRKWRTTRGCRHGR